MTGGATHTGCIDWGCIGCIVRIGHCIVCTHTQVTLNYVAMTPEGRIFDSSLEKAYAYDIRVGAGQVREHAARLRPRSVCRGRSGRRLLDAHHCPPPHQPHHAPKLHM